jgi:hypothetical protein
MPCWAYVVLGRGYARPSGSAMARGLVSEGGDCPSAWATASSVRQCSERFTFRYSSILLPSSLLTPSICLHPLLSQALDPAAWEEELTANPLAAKKPRTKSTASKDDEEAEEDTAADGSSFIVLCVRAFC